MLNKISIRWRLTILSSLLVAICCISLSVLLNMSAYRMADTIEAAIINEPAQAVGESINDEIQPVAMVIPTEVAKSNYLEYSLIYTLVAVCIGGCLTYYIAGKSLEPLKELNEQAKNMNYNNLSKTLRIPNTKDEIAELTQTFNEMTDQLNEVFLVQKRFSANVAHELRTPLSVLQTKLDVFNKKSERDVEEYNSLIKSVQNQIIRLRKLVSELLDISNLEDGFHKEQFTLEEIFDDLKFEVSSIANKEHINVSFTSNNEYVYANYDLLFRALFNMIENAIKYNVQGGNVVVFIEQNTQLTLLSIKDTGIGIPKEYITNIFEPFYRVDASRNKEIEGNGLGLSLVKTIIEKHGGEIYLKSSTSNGSEFIISLPNKK